MAELLHPMREGRSPQQMGKKGQSNHRWIVGGKLCFILNQWGLICAWDCATANVYDTHFQPLIAPFDTRMIVLTDTGCHAKTGDPASMKVCRRGTWNVRMVVETSFDDHYGLPCQEGGASRLGLFPAPGVIMAAFNILVQWGLVIDDNDRVRLSIAEFSSNILTPLVSSRVAMTMEALIAFRAKTNKSFPAQNGQMS
jgi:hypothetical protein